MGSRGSFLSAVLIIFSSISVFASEGFYPVVGNLVPYEIIEVEKSTVGIYAVKGTSLDAQSVSGGRATAFLVNKSVDRDGRVIGEFLTNAHVVEEMKSSSCGGIIIGYHQGITGFDRLIPLDDFSWRLQVKNLLAIDPVSDLALVAVELPEALASMQPVQLAEWVNEPNSIGYSLGHPSFIRRKWAKGKRPKFIHQTVYSVGAILQEDIRWFKKKAPLPTPVLVHKGDLLKGNSGGPLIDSYGRVVGINTRVSSQQYDASYRAVAVSAKRISEFLNVDRHNQKPQSFCR